MQAQTTYRPLALAIFSPASTLQRYLLMAALVIGGSIFVALSAQVRIHLSFTPVPITGQTFAVLAVGGLLGARLGAASLLLYLAEGCYGMLWGSQTTGFKVFSNGTLGWEIVSGPTGGYIIGFIFAAFVVGWLTEKNGFDRNPLTAAVALAIGNFVVYVPGLIWLDHWYQSNLPADKVPNLLSTGLYPFILGDFAKLLLAASILPLGWGLLRQVPGYKKAFPDLSGEVRTRDYRVPLAWIYLPIAAAIVIGVILPWHSPEAVQGAASADNSLTIHFSKLGTLDLGGVDIAARWVTLAAALIAAAIAGLALTRRVPWEITRVGLFAAGAVAGFATFYQISRILEARSETFALSPLGIGLIIAALASVALASASLLDREEDQAASVVPTEA
jgi:biotin transport system substrate-specific component